MTIGFDPESQWNPFSDQSISFRFESAGGHWNGAPRFVPDRALLILLHIGKNYRFALVLARRACDKPCGKFGFQVRVFILDHATSSLECLECLERRRMSPLASSPKSAVKTRKKGEIPRVPHVPGAKIIRNPDHKPLLKGLSSNAKSRRAVPPRGFERRSKSEAEDRCATALTTGSARFVPPECGSRTMEG